MSREEVYDELLSMYPSLTVDKIADMTPDQIRWHLRRTISSTITFETSAEHQRWLAKTTSS